MAAEARGTPLRGAGGCVRHVGGAGVRRGGGCAHGRHRPTHRRQLRIVAHRLRIHARRACCGTRRPRPGGRARGRASGHHAQLRARRPLQPVVHAHRAGRGGARRGACAHRGADGMRRRAGAAGHPPVQDKGRLRRARRSWNRPGVRRCSFVASRSPRAGARRRRAARRCRSGARARAARRSGRHAAPLRARGRGRFLVCGHCVERAMGLRSHARVAGSRGRPALRRDGPAPPHGVLEQRHGGVERAGRASAGRGHRFGGPGRGEPLL